MHPVDAGVYGVIVAGAIGVLEVIKRQVDKRNGVGKHVLSSDERKAIFDTARSTQSLERIAATQTEILSDVKTTLAVLSDRQQRAGGG